jgi:hypothetical protein
MGIPQGKGVVPYGTIEKCKPFLMIPFQEKTCRGICVVQRGSSRPAFEGFLKSTEKNQEISSLSIRIPEGFPVAHCPDSDIIPCPNDGLALKKSLYTIFRENISRSAPVTENHLA